MLTTWTQISGKYVVHGQRAEPSSSHNTTKIVSQLKSLLLWVVTGSPSNSKYNFAELCRRVGRSSRSNWGKVAVVEESATPKLQPCEIAAPPFIWSQSTCCDGCSFHSNLAPVCLFYCVSTSFGQCCVTPATKIQCNSRDYKTLLWPRALVLWPRVYK